MCIFCERAKASLDETEGFGDFVEVDGPRSSGSWRRSAKTSGRKWEASLKQKQEAERCEVLRNTRIPCTVVTGFLGAGKTTFVNHILSARHGLHLAVIENEFGEVSVDDALLQQGGLQRSEEAQQVILMPNGCMCCRVRGDLVDALKQIIKGSNTRARARATQTDLGTASPDSVPVNLAFPNPSLEEESSERPALDGVILECSGLAEIAPVLQTFFADPFVQEKVSLDCVVCLCDSPNLLRALSVPGNLGMAALGGRGGGGGGGADGDWEEGAEGGDVLPVETGLEEVGVQGGGGDERKGHTKLVLSQLALSDVLLVNKTDLVEPSQASWLEMALGRLNPGARVVCCVKGQVDVGLVLGVGSFSLDQTMSLDQHFLDLHQESEDDHPLEPVFSPETKPDLNSGGSGRKGEQWHGGGGGERGGGHLHSHELIGASSVGVEEDRGPIEWGVFKTWLEGFLEKEGERVWRLKGMLWITGGREGGARMMVVQGIYGHFESMEVDLDPREHCRSRIVFIGHLTFDLREELRAGVCGCVEKSPWPRPLLPKSLPEEEEEVPRPYGVGGGGGLFARRFGAVKFGVGG
ncbi:unnamed protein product, partial [Discosporangium mesarthrocarpum]